MRNYLKNIIGEVLKEQAPIVTPPVVAPPSVIPPVSSIYVPPVPQPARPIQSPMRQIAPTPARAAIQPEPIAPVEIKEIPETKLKEFVREEVQNFLMMSPQFNIQFFKDIVNAELIPLRTKLDDLIPVSEKKKK